MSDTRFTPEAAANIELGLCEDCPKSGYPTDATRCAPCPRRSDGGTLSRARGEQS